MLDHRNKPIAKPTVFEINTSIQRCLVKAIALHGLGLYIYAGEDLPNGEKEPEASGTITEAQAKELSVLIGKVNADVDKLCAYFKIDRLLDLKASDFGRAKSALNKKVKGAA